MIIHDRIAPVGPLVHSQVAPRKANPSMRPVMLRREQKSRQRTHLRDVLKEIPIALHLTRL